MSSSHNVALNPSNPFSTKFIRAGVLPFRFRKDESVQSLYRRLRRARWRGQIVGPHGSGKSTLVAALEEYWAKWGRKPICISCSNGQRKLSCNWNAWSPSTQIIVDGYEQLGRWSQYHLVYRCLRRRCGLLVTTHSPAMILPEIYRTTASLELTRTLVDELMTGTKPMDHRCVEASFVHSGGNVRETFLDLYDVYQQSNGPVGQCRRTGD